MQYISGITNDDLKTGNTSYVLDATDNQVKFYAYTGDTALGSDKQTHTEIGSRFLRKGFINAIDIVNPDITTPIYVDCKDNEVCPKSKEEAVELIYKGKLNISRFQFNENASDTQKKEELGKLINCFVSASQNPDFETDKNLFFVKNYSRIVAYNGGTPSVKIDGYDVQEKLGLETTGVEINRLRKKMQQQDGPQNKGKVNTEEQGPNKLTILKSEKFNDGK